MIEIRKSRSGFRVRYLGKNGEVLAVSETLESNANAIKNIKAMIKLITGATDTKIITAFYKILTGQQPTVTITNIVARKARKKK